MDSEFLINFGVDGSAEAVIRNGWSSPEPEICWMVGMESLMILPRPVLGAARYQLSITIRPHIREASLPHQALIVAVNNIVVAVENIVQDSTIECEVPHYAFELSDVTTLRFIHPNYASPCKIAGIDDDRLLAIAMERLILRCYTVTPPLQSSVVQEHANPIEGKEHVSASQEVRVAAQARVVRRPIHS